jgi:phenylpyruvate tautomerase PptA (4-oxalocrotonate tautomerase family)
MPLVRIDVIEGRSEADIAAISDAVHQALVSVAGVPERDQFQVIAAHPPGRLVYNRGYLGIDRTDGIVIVQVFFATGRTEEVKRALYARIAADISERTATREQDVFIVLSENTRADWSFGNGAAQYLELPREQWR